MGLSGRTIVEWGYGAESLGTLPSRDRRDDAPELKVSPHLTASNGPVGPYHRCRGEDLGGASGHAPSVNSLGVRNGRVGPHQLGAGEAGSWESGHAPSSPAKPRS